MIVEHAPSFSIPAAPIFALHIIPSTLTFFFASFSVVLSIKRAPFVFALRLISILFVVRFVADSQDVDLDAILGELCALERRCDGDIASTPAPDSQRQGRPNSTRITAGDNTDIGKNEGGMYDFFFSSLEICLDCPTIRILLDI